MIVEKIVDFLQRLRGNRRGNVLMLFAFSLLPITFATGMTIDYSRAARLQTKMNAITDAAALAGLTPAMLQKTRYDSAVAVVNMWYAQAGTTQCSAATVNNVIFKPCVNTSGDNGTVWSGSDATMTIKVTDSTVSGFTRTIVVSYDVGSVNLFSGLLGRSKIDIGGTSTTYTKYAPYIDIHVALDTSQSMGLAASDADAIAMWNATKLINGPTQGCTFGCHAYVASDSGYNASHKANDTIAANYNIKLRIDSLRDATTDMIQSAIDSQGSNSYYRFGLYRVGQSHSVISALSTNLSSSKSTAQGITLGPNNSNGVGDTNLPDTMSNLLTTITTHGDGSMQSKARAFLFLVTDGVTDVQGWCTYGHCTKPLDASTCQAFKDAGVTVGIIYTTYLPIKADPTNPSNPALRFEYTDLVQKFSWSGYVSPNPLDNSLDIKPALQSCATSGWFFEAVDGASIHTAMQTLFAQASKAPTITN